MNSGKSRQQKMKSQNQLLMVTSSHKSQTSGPGTIPKSWTIRISRLSVATLKEVFLYTLVWWTFDNQLGKRRKKISALPPLFSLISLALLRGHHNVREQYVNMQNIPARIQTTIVVKETEDCVKAV